MPGQGDDARTFFRTKFLDPGAFNLLDKVDFRGIIATNIRSFVLLIFLALIGIAQAFGQAFSNLLAAFSAMIRLVLTAPTLTLAEIQERAVAIASREILDFGLFALPVSFVAALAAIGIVVLFFNVFWRP